MEDSNRVDCAFYKHVESDEEIQFLKELFDENDILYEISTATELIDNTIVGKGLFSKYTLKLLPGDFAKANELIKSQNETRDIDIEDFRHLKDLTNEELIEILKFPEEWTSESEIVAWKILRSRNHEISKEEIQLFKNKQEEILNKGKQVPIWIQAAYFGSIVIGVYLHIILVMAGIGMGYYYAYGTEISRDGKKRYVYDVNARSGGKIILFTGIIAIIIQIVFLFKIYII